MTKAEWLFPQETHLTASPTPTSLGSAVNNSSPRPIWPAELSPHMNSLPSSTGTHRRASRRAGKLSRRPLRRQTCQRSRGAAACRQHCNPRSLAEGMQLQKGSCFWAATLTKLSLLVTASIIHSVLSWCTKTTVNTKNIIWFVLILLSFSILHVQTIVWSLPQATTLTFSDLKAEEEKKSVKVKCFILFRGVTINGLDLYS